MRKDIKTILATCQRIILLGVICMILPTGLIAQKNKTIYPNTSTDSIASSLRERLSKKDENNLPDVSET